MRSLIDAYLSRIPCPAVVRVPAAALSRLFVVDGKVSKEGKADLLYIDGIAAVGIAILRRLSLY